MSTDGIRANLFLILCVLGVPAVSQTPPRPVATLSDSTANLPVQKIGVDDLLGRLERPSAHTWFAVDAHPDLHFPGRQAEGWLPGGRDHAW